MACSSLLLSYAPHIQSSPVGKLILEFDWSSTPLGSIQQWPQSLKTVVSLMLANPSQSCLFWGPARTLIYNNAWARIVSGSKHPHLMGVPGRVAFHEIWDTFSVHCESVYQGKHVSRVDDPLFFDSQPTGELTSTSIRDDDIPLLETYFTWSYLPIQAENGEVGGILNNCIETTDKVLSERRMLTVHTLAERTALTRTTAEFWQAVSDSLTQNEHDFPFFLCYSATTTASSNAYPDAAETISNPSCESRSEYSYFSSSTSAVRHIELDLVKSCGVQPGHPAAPCKVELTTSNALESHRSWPFSKACFGRTPLRAKNLHPEGFQARSWGDTPGYAILIPIHGADDMLVGLVLFGLNTRRPYDDHYTNFHQTLLRNLNLSYIAAQAFEREMQRTEELQALDRAKTMFFQNVSHELRTPLTLIKGPCEDALKEEGKLDPTSRSRFKLIYRASGRLLRLVNSLMLFSSAEAKRLQAAYKPVRLGPVTTDLASLFRSAIEKAGINYTVDCGELDDAREVFVDLSMWEKIVFNLLSNAIKYTNEGSITLLLRFHSTEVELRVEDSGCGIPEDQKELVLQRFHRVAYAEGRSHEGTGIGLALTSELVKLHGGHIKVESTLGKGSSFIVRLPRGHSHLPAQDIVRDVDDASINKAGYGNVNLYHDHQLELGRVPSKGLGYGSYAEGIVEEANGWLSDDSETASTLSVSSESGTESSGSPQPLCILLAEDNADARSYIKTILSTIVQVVIAVPDGRVALDYIRNRMCPDLLITDVMMPGLNGLDLLQELDKDPNPDIQNLPIILLTASSGSEGKIDPKPDRFLQRPIDYLLKPFSSVELVRRVQTRLHTVRQKLELERQVQQRTTELDYAQQRYRRMTELAPVAIFETDDMDRSLITFANERFFSLTGSPRSLPLRFDETIDLIESDYQPAAEQMWSEVLDSGKSTHLELQFLNGRHALVELISLSSGSILGTLTDQTEQRRFAAQQLDAERQKTDEAMNRRRQQEAFIDIVSHELRNPISAILQSANLLSGSKTRLSSIFKELFVYFSMITQPGLDVSKIQSLLEESRSELEDVSHAVASVELCARHQTIIASDILVVSRLDSNLLSIKPTTFHLMDELQNTLAMFTVQAETQAIEFKLDVGLSVTNETRIIADPTRLGQILVNLISNSCRALESWAGNRQISFHVSLSQSQPFKIPGQNHHRQASDPALEASRIWVVFHISDTGPGIPVEDQARLFTRFNDVHTTDTNATRRSSSLEGTGLGLYLCRKLAELQGGDIKFSGIPGQGAAFFFFIEARLAEDAPFVGAPISLQTSERYRPISSSMIIPALNQIHTAMTSVSKSIATKHENGEPNLFGASMLAIPVSTRPQDAERQDHVRRAKINILIVEDNAINQKLLRRQIEKAGFTAHTANNGLEALQYLEATKYRYQDLQSGTQIYPSLILMDLEMPILDGLEATARIRVWEAEDKLPGKLLIYAITGNARQGQIDAALAAGMNDVYIKPYNIADIIRRVDLDCQPE